jgi:outer membrane protein
MNIKPMINFALAAAVIAPVSALAQPRAADAPVAGALTGGMRISSVSGDANLGGIALKAESGLSVEVSANYFLRKNVSAQGSIRFTGSRGLSDGLNTASFKPQTFALKGLYHFEPIRGARPYMGAGLQYTNVGLASPILASSSQNDVGLVIQAGLDFPLYQEWSLNLDVQKSWLKVSTSAGTFKYDPQTFGVGVGRKF